MREPLGWLSLLLAVAALSGTSWAVGRSRPAATYPRSVALGGLVVAGLGALVMHLLDNAFSGAVIVLVGVALLFAPLWDQGGDVRDRGAAGPDFGGAGDGTGG